MLVAHLFRLLSVRTHSTSSNRQLVQGAPCSTTLHRTCVLVTQKLFTTWEIGETMHLERFQDQRTADRPTFRERHDAQAFDARRFTGFLSALMSVGTIFLFRDSESLVSPPAATTFSILGRACEKMVSVCVLICTGGGHNVRAARAAAQVYKQSTRRLGVPCITRPTSQAPQTPRCQLCLPI